MERVSIDMPQGDGNPECPYCKGRGVVPVPPELRPRFSIGDILTPCFCVKERDIRMNIKRAWPVLEHVKPVKKTPLKGFENKRNEESSELFPELQEFFATVNKNTFDLMEIFSELLYFDR